MDTTGTLNVNGTTSIYTDENEIYDKYLPGIKTFSRCMRIIVYIFGYPGNLLALLVWIRKPMLQSSGVYLATLALSDLLFLLLDCIYSLHTEWDVLVLNFPIACEAFTVFYLAAQYMSPMLSLAFTTERFIAIKFPLRRRIYCTVKRAVCTSCIIAVTSLGLNGIQAYFWKFSSDIGACMWREEAQELWKSWTWGTEMTMFFCVPLLILILNLLVIWEIRKSRKIAMKLNRILFKTNASTTMLLAVSTFLIVTTLPVSVIYALKDSFPPSGNVVAIDSDTIWQVHLQYHKARTIIYNVGLTHFSMNFYIYLLAGDRFRREIIGVLKCKGVKRKIIKHRFELTKMESFNSSEIL